MNREGNMSKPRLSIIALMLALTSASASAYNVFPLDASHSLKWGSNENGTPGGVVPGA
jgi:hypothetical protein